MNDPADQPSRLSVDYPEQRLNRLTTFFRLFAALPILIVLGAVSGGTGSGATTMAKRLQPRPEACCSAGLY